MKIILSIAKFFTNILFNIKFINLKKFPNTGRVILCANHRSFWEPIILFLNLPREVSFMSKKELFKNPIVSWFLKKIKMIPVDRSSTELSTIKQCIKVLHEEGALGIFPQGTRKSSIEDEDGKSGVSLIAYKANAPISPVYIRSSYKLFSKVELIFGDLIYPNEIQDENTKIKYDKFSKLIMQRIRDIGNES